jgi:protein-tyrosine phosphatase
MIDLHCHLLPDLDDGAITIDDSIVMAKLLADFGYTTVCCTPHCIKGYYDPTPQKVREATLMLQADLDNADIRLELRPGMEYMHDECFAEFAADLLPLGETKLILCEAPQQAHPRVVQEGLELIIEKGFVPLIAHPERTDHFYELLSSRVARGVECEKTRDDDNPELKLKNSKAGLSRLLPFKKNNSKLRIHNSKLSTGKDRPELPEGAVFQANLGSFTGYNGENVQRRAYELLKQGIYTALASDLHGGASSYKILVQSNVETNPLLEKLAGWDGSIQPPVATDQSGGEQIGLF